MVSFKDRIDSINPLYSKFDTVQTLQLNLGDLCNLSCSHCHVAASPHGTKVMNEDVMERIIKVLTRKSGITLDITGGCPEMNPNFRFLLESTGNTFLRRIVRSNLVILNAKNMEWLAEFFRDHRVIVIGSLPCFMEDTVDRQRGKGVFAESIKALRKLNALGYGTELELNLVYNPNGEFLPSSQKNLEAAYKRHLLNEYGIVFSSLYTLANAPIGRFKRYLEEKGCYQRYMDLLNSSFNPDIAEHMMCRTMVSVDWQGILYNCDFNQAIGMPMANADGDALRVENFEQATARGRQLDLAQHCYCCTAGAGSSCSGVLAA